jgi:hypothetical protein
MTTTSEDWRIVRDFVTQVRSKAHETVVDKSTIQDILTVVDKLGMETVQDMIQHEKRMHNTQMFYMQKDRHDEEDFQRAEHKEASHGLSK